MKQSHSLFERALSESYGRREIPQGGILVFSRGVNKKSCPERASTKGANKWLNLDFKQEKNDGASPISNIIRNLIAQLLPSYLRSPKLELRMILLAFGAALSSPMVVAIYNQRPLQRYFSYFFFSRRCQSEGCFWDKGLG